MISLVLITVVNYVLISYSFYKVIAKVYLCDSNRRDQQGRWDQPQLDYDAIPR